MKLTAQKDLTFISMRRINFGQEGTWNILGRRSQFSFQQRQIWGNFKTVHRKNLDREEAPCVTDPNYSLTQCIREYVATTAGCHLNLIDNDGDGYPCTTWAKVLKYQNTLTNVSKLSWMELVRVTGCSAKCSNRQFIFEKVSMF